MYESKLDSAVIGYKEAFKLVDYVHFSILSYVKILLENKSDDCLKKFYIEKLDLCKPSSELDNVLDSLKKEDQRIRGDLLMAARNTYLKSLPSESFPKMIFQKYITHVIN